MKKIILSLTAIAIIATSVLISCKKDASETSEIKVDKEKNTFNGKNPNVHEMRLELLLFKVDVQKQLFNTLTADQKSLIWKDKLEQVKRENIFSNYQTELLNELESQITPDLFIVKSKSEIHFKENFHNEWIKKAKGQFAFDDLMNIVSNLKDFSQKKAPIAGGGGDKQDNCECSTSSDWCSMSMTCKTSQCLDSAHGCGTLWTYSCRGMCAWN